eukprot:GILI01029604.1.p1 GENE.GILI01029604.1~~GILI01029604.1.p1  ORF type:complete len:254 (+),score=50.57 GILI01029604.1:76-837(+)
MRNASSLLLLANANHYNSLKVLMIKRHTKARFMANMYVFPGGTMEVSDGDAASPDLGAFRKAALRELWEETSVTLNSKGEALARSAEPDYSLEKEITPFAHWITPVSEQYRYDTWFFAHSVANDETALGLDMKQCQHELADLRWVEPREALEMHRNDSDDSFRVPPPTYLFLDWLSKYQKTSAFMNSISCYKHDPRQSVPEVLPIYQGKGEDGGSIIIGSNKIHLPDGEYKARLFSSSGSFRVGDKYLGQDKQ